MLALSISRRAHLATKSRRLKSKQIYKRQTQCRSYAEQQYDDVLPWIEKAKALIYARRTGTFTSVTLKVENQHSPLVGSTLPYVLLDLNCNPIIPIKKGDDKHWQNLQEGNKAALLVTSLTPSGMPPSTVPIHRMNMMGTCTLLTDETELQRAFQAFETRHTGGGMLVKNQDMFAFHKLEPEEVIFEGSEGVIYQCKASELAETKLDPLAEHSRDIVMQINANYPDEINSMCLEYGGLPTTEAFIMSIDRLGFDILGKAIIENKPQWVEFRVPMEREISDPRIYLQQLQKSLQELREDAIKAAAVVNEEAKPSK